MELDFHLEMKQSTTRFLSNNEWKTRQEVALPNGRVADIIAVNCENKILIIEVKTSLGKTSFERVHDKYSAYCDGLYIAAQAMEIMMLTEYGELLSWRPWQNRVGLLAVQGPHVRVARQAQPSMLAPERRHQMTEAIRNGRAAW